jgi:hypothetical protein
LIRYPLSAVFILSLIACGDNAATSDIDVCDVAELPLSGGPDAPVLTDVTLDVQEEEGIVVSVVASDPQGRENLRDVDQIIKVFQDAGCKMSPIVLQDDMTRPGVPKTFGTAVPASNESLISIIAAAESWPVAVDFRDRDDNRTAGRVLARVVR